MVKLTKTVVDRAKPPATGQAFLRDSELKGFGLRITATGVKTFIVEKRIDGRSRRKKVGRYGELTCEEARREAIKYLGDVAKGEDPIADRERARLQQITLAQVFSDYLRARKALQAKTRYEYDLLLHRAFDDWQTVADYLLFLLLTGFQRQEAATLSWRQIDLASKTVRLPDPKNRQPFELPLSDFLVDLVTDRRQVAMNGYVFPGTGRRGYLVEPKRQVEKVIAVSGVPFLLHDLRRTFTSTARDLGIHPYTISRLVNHKRPGDITASYSIHGVEDLRRPMQRIADCFGAALAGQQASVVPLRSARPF